MMTFAWLTGVNPDGTRGEWRLERDEFVIGREAPADLILPLPRLSRQQARLTRLGRVYFLTDLNSRNGTFLNGQPVAAEPRRLQHGDEIVLGGVITLTFNDPGETMGGPRLGRLHGVWIDDAARAVYVDARPVDPPLSVAQFTLIKLLYDNAGHVISRAQIIAAVWPDVRPEGVSEEAVDGLIKRTRARLREAGADYIEVLRGQGLRLIADRE